MLQSLTAVYKTLALAGVWNLSYCSMCVLVGQRMIGLSIACAMIYIPRKLVVFRVRSAPGERPSTVVGRGAKSHAAAVGHE